MVARFVALVVALQSPLFLLAATVVLSSEAYVLVRYGELTWDKNAIIEALNFSIQTVTTVGYGNWEAGLSGKALLDLKLDSLPTMLVGAALFALVISGLTNFYAPRPPRPPRHCPNCGHQVQ